MLAVIDGIGPPANWPPEEPAELPAEPDEETLVTVIAWPLIVMIWPPAVPLYEPLPIS